MTTEEDCDKLILQIKIYDKLIAEVSNKLEHYRMKARERYKRYYKTHRQLVLDKQKQLKLRK